MYSKHLPLIAAAILLTSCSVFLNKPKDKIYTTTDSSHVKGLISIDSNQKAKKLYSEITSEKAKSQTGLIKTHLLDGHYYFEIPDSLLNKEILVVNRIIKGSSEGSLGPNNLFGYGGDMIGQNIIDFEKGPDNKLFIRKIEHGIISKDTTENGMFRSLQNSNLQPIEAVFEIKAYSPDSSNVVIDVTDYLKTDNDILFFDANLKKVLGLGALQADKSYIENIHSYPLNTEIKTVKSYLYGTILMTLELNSSLVLLPKTPMKPRYSDDRIGYFSSVYANFDDPKGIDPNGVSMITRWRLEPKDEDITRYIHGELVEPKKPIVFYIDPATPKKWVPYLIQGVNDWQKSFEKAGFKNAIYALEAPVNDPNWNLEDARHNAIIYKASRVSNAYGPEVCDPRTGEILESHIQWFHNVMTLIHDWYMVQCAVNDPKARSMKFDDDLMGQLIRFVSSHEVGHTLGLMHNFGASSTIPVDSLRSKKYVEQHGFCPSIMDYARFNYVAQPEDHIDEKGLFPRIGEYDNWAIEWGYKWLPEFKSKEQERSFFNHWIIDSLNKNSRLWYGTQQNDHDWRCQSEDLGDNSMKASYYGLLNLKKTLSHLIEWTAEPNTGYENLVRMQTQVFIQYQRYMFHVARNIGSWSTTSKTVEQVGPVHVFSSRGQQKEAMDFLQKQLFTTPEWLANRRIFSLVGSNGYVKILHVQDSVLNYLTSLNTLGTLLYFQANHPKTCYSPTECLKDLRQGIWSELKNGQPISLYRRNLQKLYVTRLTANSIFDSATPNSIWNDTDISSVIQTNLRDLLREINRSLPLYKDGLSKSHLIDVSERIKKILNISNQYNTQNNKKI